jgi:hypothetical protein
MIDIRNLISETQQQIAEFEKSVPEIERVQAEHNELNRQIEQTRIDEDALLRQHSGDIDNQTEHLLVIRARRDVLKSRLTGGVEDAWERSYELGGRAWQNFDRLCSLHYQRCREASPDKQIEDRFSFGTPQILFGSWLSKEEKFSRRRSIIYGWERELGERFNRLAAAIMAMEEPAKPVAKVAKA